MIFLLKSPVVLHTIFQRKQNVPLKIKLIMEKEMQGMIVNLRLGHQAKITVTDNSIVRFEFGNEKEGMSPYDLNKHIDHLEKAILEFKKVNSDYEPKVPLYQGKNVVVYYYKRILWTLQPKN